jgi:dihydroorotate dehydrogenase
MSLYSSLIRSLLFQLDAETAHHGTVEACRLAGALPLVPEITRACLEFKAPELQCEAAGMQFDHPIGLAAGWDKSGRALRMLDHLGFAFAEIGSISAQPSQGNPKPRLFRLPQDQAIIVNYGLPNDGAEVIAPRLAAHRMRIPLGVNIVKTNYGPGAPACGDEDILADYERSVSLVHRHAGYLMLNLSCPNAADGKDFYAQPGNIARLLQLLKPLGITCPVFLKVAPRDDPAEHERLLAETDSFAFVRGFSFNLPPGKPTTTTLRLSTPRSEWENLPGAVSGKPVEDLINRCIAGLASRMNRQRHVIIGTGGVFTAADAYRKLRLGASLVQIYTALIYEGPGVIARINRGLCQLLARDGFRHVSEAVGADL